MVRTLQRTVNNLIVVMGRKWLQVFTGRKDLLDLPGNFAWHKVVAPLKLYNRFLVFPVSTYYILYLAAIYHNWITVGSSDLPLWPWIWLHSLAIHFHSILSFFLTAFPSFSFPDVLFDPTDVIWRCSRTGFIRWFQLKFSWFFSASRQMPGDLCTIPRIISLSSLSLPISDWHDTRG